MCYSRIYNELYNNLDFADALTNIVKALLYINIVVVSEITCANTSKIWICKYI